MEIAYSSAFFESAFALLPKYGQSGYVTTDEKWVGAPMYSPFSRLYYVIDGSGVLTTDYGEVSLERGYVYLVPMGAKCGFFGTPSVRKLFFHINLVFEESGSDAFLSFDKVLRMPYPTSRMEKMAEDYLSEDKSRHLFVMGELYRTVYEFLQMKTDAFSLPPSQQKLLTDAMHYIRTHLCATLGVGAVAAAMPTSRGTLTALFSRALGRSVAAYIGELVMSEAQSMLIYTDMSIGQISERLGFCDQFYFSRCFRKHFHVPPSTYRRQN